MSFFQQQKTTEYRQDKCPACERPHTVLNPFGIILVMICPLIRDLIYVDKIMATRETRERVRESLLGC